MVEKERRPVWVWPPLPAWLTDERRQRVDEGRGAVRCPYCGDTEHIAEARRWTMEQRDGTEEKHIKWSHDRQECGRSFITIEERSG